jgi:hypothetical protein
MPDVGLHRGGARWYAMVGTMLSIWQIITRLISGFEEVISLTLEQTLDLLGD